MVVNVMMSCTDKTIASLSAQAYYANTHCALFILCIGVADITELSTENCRLSCLARNDKASHV